MTGFAFVIGVVVLIVGLAVSIALHEIGHLLPAKAFGVRVGQYMIGFGPTLFSKKMGETEYGFKLLPLGGYISMAGMYPPVAERTTKKRRTGRLFQSMIQDARSANEETLQGVGENRVFYRLPVWRRVVVMLGGPVMNLLLAMFLLTIVFSGIGVQTATNTVNQLSDCVPASLQSSQCVATPTPAEQAGLQPGDQIVSVDGAAVSNFTEASQLISQHPDEQISMVINRNGTEQTASITPAATKNANGQTVGFIGISPTVKFVRQPIWAGPATTFDYVGRVAQVIVTLPVTLYHTAQSVFVGAPRDPNGPLSLVGAGQIAGEVASANAPVINRVSGMLGLLASLNIALFLFNLIPLLPLDGGHVIVALWDGVKRAWAKLFRRGDPRPVDATKLVPVTFVVVVLLIGMGALLIAADLINPVSLS